MSGCLLMMVGLTGGKGADWPMMSTKDGSCGTFGLRASATGERDEGGGELAGSVAHSGCRNGGGVAPGGGCGIAPWGPND